MSSNGPRILTLDIETSPGLAYVWSLWGENVPLVRLIEPGRVISLAGKWYDRPSVLFRSEFHQTADEMILFARDLLDQADVVVTYNGDKFDLPHLRREFMERGLTPPSPFHSIDLYKVVRKQAKFMSNKLEHITTRLELSGKLRNDGFELWARALEGDPKAWAQMRRYNRQDVVTTEELYTELLPWIDGHPALTLYVDDSAPLCPRCLKDALERRGYATTKLGKYQRYQCRACGAWARGARRIEGVDIR